ncbi:MerR family transcriptional regulator, partial [Streptomyces sp. NPDC051658]
SIKTIRVYHDKRLLPEPDRDASGYRRYGANDTIDLIKIRTLAEAGVPWPVSGTSHQQPTTSSSRRCARSTTSSPTAFTGHGQRLVPSMAATRHARPRTTGCVTRLDA